MNIEQLHQEKEASKNAKQAELSSHSGTDMASNGEMHNGTEVLEPASCPEALEEFFVIDFMKEDETLGPKHCKEMVPRIWNQIPKVLKRNIPKAKGKNSKQKLRDWKVQHFGLDVRIPLAHIDGCPDCLLPLLREDFDSSLKRVEIRRIIIRRWKAISESAKDSLPKEGDANYISELKKWKLQHIPNAADGAFGTSKESSTELATPPATRQSRNRRKETGDQKAQSHGKVWTREEHQAFLQGVETFGKQWTEIAKIVPSRSVDQIKCHWWNHRARMKREEAAIQETVAIDQVSTAKRSKAKPRSHGKMWTREEHQAFLQGVEKFGTQWAEVAKIVPSRSEDQIKNHWIKHLARMKKEEAAIQERAVIDQVSSLNRLRRSKAKPKKYTSPKEGKTVGGQTVQSHGKVWTREEHQAFLQGVETFGKQWAEIAKIVPSRSVDQIKCHWWNHRARMKKEETKVKKKEQRKKWKFQHIPNAAAAVQENAAVEQVSSGNRPRQSKAKPRNYAEALTIIENRKVDDEDADELLKQNLGTKRCRSSGEKQNSDQRGTQSKATKRQSTARRKKTVMSPGEKARVYDALGALTEGTSGPKSPSVPEKAVDTSKESSTELATPPPKRPSRKRRKEPTMSPNDLAQHYRELAASTGTLEEASDPKPSPQPPKRQSTDCKKVESSTWDEESDAQGMIVDFARSEDVLFGDRRESKHHPGNIQLRELIRAATDEYKNTERGARKNVVLGIVAVIKENGGQCLLARKDMRWEVLSDNEVFKRVCPYFHIYESTDTRPQVSQSTQQEAPEKWKNQMDQQEIKYVDIRTFQKRWMDSPTTEAFINWKNGVVEEGRTMLLCALFHRRWDIARLLIDHGADTTIADESGWTALMYVSYWGHEGLVDFLSEDVANVKIADKKGDTALMKASRRDNCKIVKLLLEKGADIDVPNKKGRTALMWASLRRHSHMVKLLLKKGADIECADDKGETALMVACYQGHVDIVRLLLQNGANASGKNKGGQSPSDLAYQQGHIKIVDLLRGKKRRFKKQGR